MKLRSYAFDAFGPYPIALATLFAGLDQAQRNPPEWGQGAGAFGQRFGSNLAIAAVTTTTRYALAEAFREDTVYYRCECKGFFRRFRHAMISTVTARHGEDGHRRLSFPSLVSPYVGTMTAVYGWYPSRYGPKDALRMGNYTLLEFMGENLALEFIYGGPHTLFSHLHRPALTVAPRHGTKGSPRNGFVEPLTRRTAITPENRPTQSRPEIGSGPPVRAARVATDEAIGSAFK